MNDTLKKEIKKTLARALADFKKENEAFEFLESFLTPQEFETLAKRLSVAYWLSKKRSYENIKTNLKVSSATIAEAGNLLKKKSVVSAIKRIEADAWAEKWSKKIASLTPKL